MCINCKYRHMLIMAAVFSRDVGALADFTLPPKVHDGQTDESEHRRAIGLIGEAIQTLLPATHVETRPVPESVREAARNESAELFKALYNRPATIGDITVPGGAVLAHAGLAALFYAEQLMYVARQIEETVRQQARENPTFLGPRAMAEEFAKKRSGIARQVTSPVEFCDGTTSADDDEFPSDTPEAVRDAVRRMRAAGLPVSMVEVVASPGPANPIGTGPDGKLH